MFRLSVSNPYTDVEVWVDFTHSDGRMIRRPAFWDGAARWRCRFASPQSSGQWRWQAQASAEEHQLEPGSGTLPAGPAAGPARGLLGLAPGRRTLAWADGSPLVVVADTASAMPWRATVTDVERYAADRHGKGSNAVLLMTVQPDMGASGPRGRNLDLGFEVGFEDLPDGHLNQLNVEYFQYFDQILAVLSRYELIPVLQPVFHGFGWKGLGVAGPVVPPVEYARYCRYLVARYGARPAIYLVGADGAGTVFYQRPEVVRSTPGTPTVSPPASTISPMPAPTPTRRPTGSTSSRVKPATKAITCRIGWPTCGATSRPRV